MQTDKSSFSSIARGCTWRDKWAIALLVAFRSRPGFWRFLAKLAGERDYVVTLKTRSGPARIVFNPLHTSELTVVDELLPGHIYTVNSPAGNFLDCGAFRGISTIYLQDQAKAVRVVAFEPQHENFSVLKRRLAKYYPDAVCINAAVGAENASVLFEGGGVGGSVGAEGCPVRMVRLRDRLTGGDAEGLLLKMDIEGAEREVLQDLLPVLPHECSLFLETHFPPGPSEALVGLFREAGFAVKECRRRKKGNSDVLFIDWTLHR
jgi:FkbM family methyltransferase